MEEKTQDTLRDTIEQAIETVDTPVDSTIETKQDRLRDDEGKFAKADTQEAAPVVEETPQPQRPPRPSSWKKDYEQYWETLDPKLADYINQREQEYAKGVSTYKNQWDQAAPLYNAIQQFMPELQQHNISPDAWITSLGNAHKTLALGTPEQKLQMFAKLANDYGVPLQALTGNQVDPQFSMLAQELNSIKSEWGNFRQQQEQQEFMTLQNEIAEFSKNAPHMEEVRETMAGLLQAGLAKDLQTAYDKAIRMNDDLWQRQQAEQAQAKQAELVQKAAQAKGKAVSTRSAAPTGSMTTGTGKKSTRDILSEQLDAVMGGHI